MPRAASAGRTVRTTRSRRRSRRPERRWDSRSVRIRSASALRRPRHGLARHEHARRIRRGGAVRTARSLRHHANVTFANLKGEFVDRSFTDPTVTGDPARSHAARDGPVPGRFRPSCARPVGRRGVHPRARRQHVRHRSDFEDKLPINRNVTGFFVEARPDLGERAFVTGGLRVERIARDALEGDGFRSDARRTWTTTSSGR